MRQPLSYRDLLWLAAVLVIGLVWYLDRAALIERADMYEREFLSCHEKLEQAQREIDRRQQPPIAPRQPFSQSQVLTDPTPDAIEVLKDFQAAPGSGAVQLEPSQP